MKICVFFIALIFSQFLFSQSDSLPQNGTVIYRQTFQHPDSLSRYPEINHISTELNFDKTKSLFTWFKRGTDSLVIPYNKLSMTGHQKTMIFTVSPVDYKGNLVYRNFKTKKIILRVAGIGGLEPYIINGKWIPLKWKLSEKHKTILGLDAQMATTFFRGRKYIAWFTREIPFSYGPWKLYGLPGLILEAHDSKNVMNYAVTKICYPCFKDSKPIKKPEETEHKTLKEHVFFQDHLIENIQKEISKKMGDKLKVEVKTFYDLPLSAKELKAKRQHSPEIIYSWEK